MKPLKELVRPNIWSLKPYSSARDEYSGFEATVFLDANENPFNPPYNRYPDPLQHELKEQLSVVKEVPAANIFLGNGSDEAIDLVFRVFCEPRVDNVVAISPTYGMYQVCAEINGVDYRNVSLDATYQFTADALLKACDAHTKVIFLCSPNNPTGNDLNRDEMVRLLSTQSDCAQHIFQSLGQCRYPSGNGLCLNRDHFFVQQGEISLQCQSPDPAAGACHVAQALRYR